MIDYFMVEKRAQVALKVTFSVYLTHKRSSSYVAETLANGAHIMYNVTRNRLYTKT